MGNKSTSLNDMEWTKTYIEIKSNHDEAYRRIDSAITLEEEDRHREALEQYKNGIAIIDRILNIHVECPTKTDQTWEDACRMIQKIKRTRGEILKRICSLQSRLENQPTCSAQVPVTCDSPPSYEEAVSDTSSTTTPQTYSELASALENLHVESENNNQHLTLLYSQDNVRIYFISPDGTVASFSDLQTLKLYNVIKEKKERNEPTAFLEVNDWVYPLIPGVSPCYKSEFGALIVPDINGPAPGSAIGIVLPPEVDINILINLLDDLVHGIVVEESEHHHRGRRAIPPSSISQKISNGLINSAWYMREGLIKGAEAAGSLINYTTPKIINRINPAQEPTAVNPKLTQGLQTAKSITGTAVSVTGFVAEKLGSATMSMGRYLAPHIQKQGTKLLKTGLKMDEDVAHQRVDDVLTIAAGAVEGLATVYSGLEHSSKILGQNITQNTVKIVEHKYGSEAGEAAGDSIYTVGNLYVFSHSMNLFKPTKMAKVAAKGTGKGILRDFRDNHLHIDTEDFVLPDLNEFHQRAQQSTSKSEFMEQIKK